MLVAHAPIVKGGVPLGRIGGTSRYVLSRLNTRNRDQLYYRCALARRLFEFIDLLRKIMFVRNNVRMPHSAAIHRVDNKDPCSFSFPHSKEPSGPDPVSFPPVPLCSLEVCAPSRKITSIPHQSSL